MSLAAKSTQSSLLQHTQPNTSLNKTNLNSSDVSGNFESFSKNFDKATSLLNKVAVSKKLNTEDTSQRTSQSNKKRVPFQNLSIMNDLHNFEEFNDSFNITKASQKFKKPAMKRSSTTKTLVEHKKSISEGNTLPSSSKLSGVRLGVDSDDEFENPANMTVFNLAKTKRTILRNDSDDEFETSLYPSKILKKNTAMRIQPVKKTIRERKKQSKVQCDFIEKEAEVSTDTILISDDEISEDGSFEESFVDDATQNMVNDTDMQAKYLQSVRSPENNRKFKLPAHIRPITSDIFSQAVDPEEQNSYVYDSFCVRTQDIGTEPCDLSELEILENKLKERKKNKRKASRCDNNRNSKRRKNIILDSDSE
ncbi:hypothetical protein WA026_017995 [Henosepilachna vigintioctopunctata]|uniref:Uncharacterized protein n=1 Tax=Henosepilachna vigintioctopunctata TaxID=420089 RepID=A0AAW1TQC2_9CUCU